MCFKCVLRALVADAQAAEAEQAGQTQPAEDLDRAHSKASINSIQADAVHKLAQAAKWLSDANFHSQAERVTAMLDALLPPVAKKAKKATESSPTVPSEEANSAEQVNQASASANAPLTPEFPAELSDLIRKLRSEGFDVDVVRIPL